MKIKIEDLLSRKLNVGNRIPLRKWENEWQLPDECKIERYETNLKIHGKEIKIERYRLLGKMGNSSSIKAKKFYKGLLTRGLPYIIENGCVWCILKSNFSPNIIAKASYLSTDGKWLYLKVPEDKIGVWYKNRLNKINFCIIPKEIDLTDEFWEVFGILQGEMTRKSEDIRVSNTEPLVINLILYFFDRSKLILKDDWNITVSVNSKNIPQNGRDEFSKKIKEYWSAKLNIPPEKITNIFWYDQFNSTLDINYGEINLTFENACLKKVIDLLLEFAKREAVKNKKYAIPFLRGLFAAEGNVTSDKTKRLLEIRLSAKKLEERKLYKRICKVAGLEAVCEIKHHHVRIHGLINFLKCLKNDIFRFHEKRKRKFITCLKNFITIKALYCILECPRGVREIVKILQLKDYRNLNKNLSKLAKENLLYRVKVGRYFVYYPTPELRSLLHLIDQC
jgi:hypothetical protein